MIHEYLITDDNNPYLKLSWIGDTIHIIDLTDEKNFEKYTKNIYFSCKWFSWIKGNFNFIKVEIENNKEFKDMDYKLIIEFPDTSLEEEFYFKLKYC